MTSAFTAKVHRIQLPRPISWSLEPPWENVDLAAFGLQLLSPWTEWEDDEQSEDIGPAAYRSSEGATLFLSRTLVLRGAQLPRHPQELLVRLAQRLRFVTGQVSVPRTFVAWSYADPECPEWPLPTPRASRSMLNPLHFGAPLTAELCREAGRALDVPPAFLFLADAVEAGNEQDHTRAVLYSALAAEMASFMRVDELSALALAAGEDTRFRVTQAGGATRDEVLDSLRRAAKNKADLLLHEIPLYLSRRSLMRDDPVLWEDWTRLRNTRNRLAHQGSVDANGDGRLVPLTSEGAGSALETAVRIFEWWGLPAERFLATTRRDDASDDLGFISP